MAGLVSTSRTIICDKLLACLKRIKKGETVRPGSDQVFQTTLRKCYTSRINFTEIPDGFFPLVFFLDDDITNFVPTSELTYDADWFLSLVLVTKDPNKTQIGHTKSARLIEGFYRDVALAIHCGKLTSNPTDIDVCAPETSGSITIEGFDIESINDSSFGIGVLRLRIAYSENFRV